MQAQEQHDCVPLDPPTQQQCWSGRRYASNQVSWHRSWPTSGLFFCHGRRRLPWGLRRHHLPQHIRCKSEVVPPAPKIDLSIVFSLFLERLLSRVFSSTVHITSSTLLRWFTRFSSLAVAGSTSDPYSTISQTYQRSQASSPVTTSFAGRNYI